MNNNSFCHLHLHSQYSYLDGFGNAESYVKRAKDLGFTALACTDHGNIDGLIEFQKKCKDREIIPILGCEAYIVSDLSIKVKGEKRNHITLLIKNEEGFKNLCKMLTIANMEGFYKRPRIDFRTIREYYKGLIILTGCSASFLLNTKGEKCFDYLYDKMKDDIYFEMMPHDFEGQKIINNFCLDLSKDYDLKFVATNDCHYIEENDDLTHEVLLAIQTKAKWEDTNRFRFSLKGLHLRSVDEMFGAFRKLKIFSDREINEYLVNTMEVVDKCKNFSIRKKEIYLPPIPGYENKNSDLFKLAMKKLNSISNGWDKEKKETYHKRLLEEWGMIKKKNFISYFCLVKELVDWCKENDIMIGPGRGSVGGSLLAYLLEITCVDPIKYNLLFSRFITEERIDFPDIDIDFEDKKREQIREHLEKIYGKNKVVSISTFLKMKGRASIRDVCRVFDLPLKEVDTFAKEIDRIEEDEDCIEKAIKTDIGRVFYKKYHRQVDLASELQGQIKGTGQHAAGVIISADNLRDGSRGNLCMRSGQAVINWSMTDAEYMGLIKLDILGLNTLTILNETNKIIQENTGNKIVYEDIPLNEIEVYREISEGNNIGVFQLNTWSTSKLAQEIKCKNIYELSDIIALVRPGASGSGMTDMYMKRKKQNWKSENKNLYDKIVKDTYGIIVYQEQIMEVIHKIAGLPYSTADKIRKIISKKRDAKEFAPFKKAFLQGCLSQKIFSRKEALDFWEMLQYHARYGFNRSHSIAYAILAYWTAYTKFHYPTEFICANLTYGSDGKKEELVQEAYRLGLKLILPRRESSDPLKWIAKEKNLYIPLIEIKGIGEKLAVRGVDEKQKIEQEENTEEKKIKIAKPLYEGFFEKKKIKVIEKKKEDIVPKLGKLDKLINEISYLQSIGDDKGLSKYFSFSVLADTDISYPNLVKTIPHGFSKSLLKTYLTLDKDLGFLGFIKKNKDFYLDDILVCQDCELCRECRKPVLPSIGKYNVGIWGEAPGENEDEQGKGFIGRAGNILWVELGKYKLYREDFYISNVNKCYPKMSKTPSKEQIKKCSKWLNLELDLIKPKLILVFGNTGLKAFSDRDSGITELSGTTEWIDKISAWVCWCIHPSAVLRNNSNRIYFERGIENFSEKISNLGDII